MSTTNTKTAVEIAESAARVILDSDRIQNLYPSTKGTLATFTQLILSAIQSAVEPVEKKLSDERTTGDCLVGAIIGTFDLEEALSRYNDRLSNPHDAIKPSSTKLSQLTRENGELKRLLAEFGDYVSQRFNYIDQRVLDVVKVGPVDENGLTCAEGGIVTWPHTCGHCSKPIQKLERENEGLIVMRSNEQKTFGEAFEKQESELSTLRAQLAAKDEALRKVAIVGNGLGYSCSICHAKAYTAGHIAHTQHCALSGNK